MGWPQVYGIGSRSLLYKEVVAVQWNYKKSYFCWFRNSACGDSARGKRIEKGKVVYLLDLFEGMRKKRHCNVCVERH